MANILNLLILLIALQHIGFLVLEMFFWVKPVGLRIFGQTLEKALSSKTLAANQGLYNGFLSAGLIWSLLHDSPEFSYQLQIFFLSCVAVAGFYGAYSVSRLILFVQAVPAVLGLVILLLS